MSGTPSPARRKKKSKINKYAKRRRAERSESLELRLLNEPGTPGSTLRLRAHRDELIAIEIELGPRLQLASDGALLTSPI